MLIWLVHSTNSAVCGICGICGSPGVLNLWKIQSLLKPKGFLLGSSAPEATGDSFCFSLDKKSLHFTFLIAFLMLEPAWPACGPDPEFVENVEFVENHRICGRMIVTSAAEYVSSN